MTLSSPCRRALSIMALLLAAATYAADCPANQGSATLSSLDGQLVLLVELPTPPPVNLIAELNLPTPAQIVSATPRAAKIDAKRSMVKWLVKNPRPGRLRFSVTTREPVAPASATGVVTYRSPADASLVRIQAGRK